MTGPNQPPEGKGDRVLSQPRPLTLLVSCGIVLAAALLIVTGLVAGYLRQQTLDVSQAGLSRLDAVLVEAGNRTFLGVETLLADGADVLPPDVTVGDASEAALAADLDRRVRATSQIAGMALVSAEGTVISHAGSWPSGEANVATRDYFAALQSQPGLATAIGAPIVLDDGGVRVIPFAHKRRSTAGGFAGVVVAAIPVSDFDSLYKAIPLGDGGIVSLVRGDGAVLAQFPPREIAGRALSADLLAALTAGPPGVFAEDRDTHGQWFIDAVQPLADYPAAVVVSISGAHALAGWSRQAAMFGAFAILGIMSIGLMVALIGRQIRTHDALAVMRADKIEVEHARLLAEAELLKKERLSMLGQFTAAVANELRNPLASIRNTLFTMREIATTSGLALDRPIARIQRSIARCDRIIGDLLEFTRSPELSRVPVDFDEWLHDVLVEHRLPPAVTLATQHDASGAIVRIDADRIRHVVINLIDNAAQALGEMPPGSGPLRISVSTAFGNGVMELTVADTGPGIAPENMARVFEPLFSTKSFGAGLGLSTVKQIVVQHGGTIAIDSKPGTGTTVTIRLPVEQMLRIAA